jgi:hypothetical protein
MATISGQGNLNIRKRHFCCLHEPSFLRSLVLNVPARPSLGIQPTVSRDENAATLSRKLFFADLATRNKKTATNVSGPSQASKGLTELD